MSGWFLKGRLAVGWLVLGLGWSVATFAAPQEVVYIFEGDSITADSPKAWPRQLRALYEPLAQGRTLNVARRGTKSVLLQRDYVREVRPHKPSEGQRAYYFVALGSVDLVRGAQTAEDIFHNLRSAWLMARQDGFRVVAFTVKAASPIQGDRERVRQRLNELILQASADYDRLVRLDQLFGNPPNSTYLLGDGLHPSRAGHEAIAKLVIDVLKGD